MKTVLLVPGGRPVPNALVAYLEQTAGRIRVYEPGEDPIRAVEGVAAVLLLSPCWVNRAYEYAARLWYIFLRQHYSDVPLVVAGYEQAPHHNYLDLLQLDHPPTAWWDQLQPVLACSDTDYPDSLGPKLDRFFAGHGTDSIVAVLIRIRLVVQMGQRELLKMHTPYAEVYQDLIAPAQLAQKWTEWRNRWVNYYPLFSYTPLAAPLKIVAEQALRLDDWMLKGGAEEGPLASGEILTILNALRGTLQEIENQYVLQKLSHSHR